MDFSINWLSVFVGAVGMMLLGWLWYSDMLFGKRWREALSSVGTVPNNQGGMGKRYTLTFLAALVTSAMLNSLVISMGIFSMSDAILSAFLLWLGLSGATSFTMALFEQRPSAFWAINAGYTLLSFILVMLVAVQWP